MPERHRRWLRRAAVLAAAGVVVVGVVVFLVTGRIDHVEVRFPKDQPGDTWVLVGSDSRDRLESDAGYLVGEGRPTGARADVVMAVRTRNGVTTALMVPRDVMVTSSSGSPVRLTHTLDPDPQELLDALCVDIGIAADHLAIVDMEGLIDLVDAMGGVSVELDHAVRDKSAGLDLPAGEQLLDGEDALALVRSRSGVELHGDRWVDFGDGAGHRMRAGAEVFVSMGDRLRSLWRDPVRLARSTWVATDAVTMDRASTLLGLGGLGAPVETMNLPTEDAGGVWALRLADDASATVSRFTGSDGCGL